MKKNYVYYVIRFHLTYEIYVGACTVCYVIKNLLHKINEILIKCLQNYSCKLYPLVCVGMTLWLGVPVGERMREWVCERERRSIKLYVLFTFVYNVFFFCLIFVCDDIGNLGNYYLHLWYSPSTRKIIALNHFQIKTTQIIPNKLNTIVFSPFWEMFFRINTIFPSFCCTKEFITFHFWSKCAFQNINVWNYFICCRIFQIIFYILMHFDERNLLTRQLLFNCFIISTIKRIYFKSKHY